MDVEGPKYFPDRYELKKPVAKQPTTSKRDRVLNPDMLTPTSFADTLEVVEPIPKFMFLAKKKGIINTQELKRIIEGTETQTKMEFHSDEPHKQSHIVRLSCDKLDDLDIILRRAEIFDYHAFSSPNQYPEPLTIWSSEIDDFADSDYELEMVSYLRSKGIESMNSWYVPKVKKIRITVSIFVMRRMLSSTHLNRFPFYTN